MAEQLGDPEIQKLYSVDRDLFMIGVVGALGAEIDITAYPPSEEPARPDDLVGIDRGQGYSDQWVSSQAAPAQTRLAS